LSFSVAVYYYSPAVLSLLTTYLAAGNNPDQPGRFVQWLYTRKPVKTFQINGKWLDIGSKKRSRKLIRFSARSKASAHGDNCC
jgi:glucose-1-phosphate thymidylyltransferase